MLANQEMLLVLKMELAGHHRQLPKQEHQELQELQEHQEVQEQHQELEE